MKPDEPYMNGRGIQQRTDDLLDALWGRLIVWIIAINALILPASVFIFSVSRRPSEPPASAGVWTLFILLAVPCALFALWASVRWCRAAIAVNRHNRAMEKATRLYGKGWARS